MPTDLTLIEGNTFCISAVDGNLRPGQVHGLFVNDLRILCGWSLEVDGVAPRHLSAQSVDPFAAVFVAQAVSLDPRHESSLVVERRRYVGNGMREDIRLRASGAEHRRVRVDLRLDADFADLFEVKAERVRDLPAPARRITGAAIVLELARYGRTDGVEIRADGDPVVDDGGLCWLADLPPGGTWTASVAVVPLSEGTPGRLHHPLGAAPHESVPARRMQRWRSSSPTLRTPDRVLGAVMGRAVDDLGALRMFDAGHPERAVVAAGAPWFMALFGRDSLLTSYMLMPLSRELALGTLQTLADTQGRTVERDSEEEPGRIVHEYRFGPNVAMALGGRNAYYGTVDATALFVVVLGELHRWGHDRAAVAELLPAADRALEWLENYGDRDGDGFVEYARRTERGLVNQGWKDSWDGISFADGRIPEAPIALAEVQAYSYAAFLARAELATAFDDPATAARWTARAAELKTLFNERFWLPDSGWFAVALDRDKRPVDALTSNIGHCLWAGIVADDRAAAVADSLLSAEMFTGWGIRTLATSMGRYNPVSYHNGSVWPHDSALCVAGLTRYGFTEHAQRVVDGIVDAAEHFGDRLPELFCGFAKDDFPGPVQYPSACSPQAWAAAAPLLLLRSMLRLEPGGEAGSLRCAPAVPARYLPLRLGDLDVGGVPVTVDVDVVGWSIS